jgi:transglutaminase-like putative cysteine protease
MRRYFIAILLLCSFLFAGIAEARRHSPNQIKNHVERTPRKVENYLPSLADYLSEPFDNDYDKAMAIAFWIASRINYDEYLYSDGKTSRLRGNYRGQNPNQLIQSRVGICGDFADLFVALCRKAGIQAREVVGYAYPSGKFVSSAQKKNSGHAWNYFMYKGKKVYVDTTFMAKGTTGVKGVQNHQNRRRALNKIKRKNKRKSNINEFDDYYFNFNYKDEIKDRKYIHEER